VFGKRLPYQLYTIGYRFAADCDSCNTIQVKKLIQLMEYILYCTQVSLFGRFESPISSTSGQTLPDLGST
jgi:hypothetical protein